MSTVSAAAAVAVTQSTQKNPTRTCLLNDGTVKGKGSNGDNRKTRTTKALEMNEDVSPSQ